MHEIGIKKKTLPRTAPLTYFFLLFRGPPPDVEELLVEFSHLKLLEQLFAGGGRRSSSTLSSFRVLDCICQRSL